MIVAAPDLGLPAWLVALAALGGAAGGVYAMNRVKTRHARQPAGGLARSGAAMASTTRR